MATLPRLLAAVAIAVLTTGGALAQTAPSADATPPGTGAADLPHGPIVNGKQLQPRAGQPPSRQETKEVDRLLQSTPPDAAADGPLVQPRDLYGNPLGGSPGLDTKKP
jgi:hypothetical protein